MNQEKMLRQIQNKDWLIVNRWMFEIAEQSFGKVIPEILEKKIKEDYQKEPLGFIVSEAEGVLNGLLWYSTFHEKKSAFIHAIYVVPEYRGKGVSDQLLDYLERYCKENKLESIELNVTVSLEHAIQFYRRRGFEIKRYTMEKSVS